MYLVFINQTCWEQNLTTEEISKQELEQAVQAFTESVKITNETLPLLAMLIRLAKAQGKIEARNEMKTGKC